MYPPDGPAGATDARGGLAGVPGQPIPEHQPIEVSISAMRSASISLVACAVDSAPFEDIVSAWWS
jgi:hypothetical protein